MPDIGALNIRISSESTQAEQGLTKVADALGRIKNALANAGLGNVASALNRINKAINGIRVDGTIENLNGLAAALKRVKEASDFTAPDLKGMGRLKKSIEDATKSDSSVTKAADAVKDSAGTAGDGFATIGQSISEARESADSLNKGMEEVGSTASRVASSAKNDMYQVSESIIQMNREMHEKYKLDPEARREYNMQSTWRYIQGETDPAVQEAMAKASGFTLQEIFDRFAPNAEAMKQQIQELLDMLNTPVKVNWAESINRMLGIGQQFKSAEESASAFTETTNETQRQIAELLDMLNRPIQMNWAQTIDRMMGIDDNFKSAADSASVFTENVTEAYQKSQELINALNKPIKVNWAESIDRMMGIGQGFKSAEESARAFTENVTEAYEQSQNLINMLNQPINMNWSQAIDNMMGINNAPKSAEDSMRAFMEGMEESSQTAQNLRADNPELFEFKQQLDEAGISAHEFNEKLIGVDGELKAKKKDAGDAGNAFDGLKKRTGALGKAIDKLGRMFSSMVMRMAIKSILKNIKASWEAMYNFSKATNGEFAQSIDKMKGLFAASATNVLKTFAPAIEALVPIVNVVAVAIQYLCNMIQKLLSLLGLSSDLWGVSADSINKYSKAAGGGSAKTKEILASFDELNVISSKSGGGGGGGGGLLPGGISDAVSDEMAKLQMIVGESLLAIGLILAMTGHIPLGVGLMAIGAAAIVKTIINDWGKLTEETQRQITDIMAVCSVGFLALGFLLAATGHIGLGIGLMFLGAANMAGLVAMGFNGMLSDEMKKQAGEILAIGGAVLFAAGLILAFAGHIGLGIGLMVAGGAAVGTAVALNWDKIRAYIQQNANKIAGIMAIVGSGMLALGAILTFSGANVPLGIGLMLGGAATIGAAAALNWDKVKGWINQNSGKIVNVLGIVGCGMLALGAILTFSGANIPLGIGLMLGGAASLAGVAALSWDKIRAYINDNSRKITDVLKVVGVGMLALGAILTFSGVNIGLGIGLMLGGAASLGLAVALNWDTVKSYINNNVQKIANILAAVSAGMLALGAILLFSGVNIPLGLGLIAAGVVGVVVAKAMKEDWNGVTDDIRSSCDKIDSAMKNPLDTLTDLVTQGDLWKKLGDLSKTITVTVETVQKVKKITEGSSTVTGSVNSALETAAEINNDGSIWGNIVNVATKVGEAAMNLMGMPVVDLKKRAAGAYNIPRGELFIANESGPEMVGMIDGKPSVANQQQIVEGISKGVYDANQEQNSLLRQQNELLRQLLEKEFNVNLGASAAFGRTVKQSLDAYNAQAGGY